MSSRFLGTQNATGITDGTLNIKGATLAGDNLVTGKPVRSNAAKQIVSTDLLISDVQGLQTVLDNPSFQQVTVSEDILPENDDESDIGQPAKRFKHGYFVAITPTTINGPVSITGGDLNMQIRKISNLATPTSSADATTKTYVDTANNLKLNLAGGTLTGQLQCQDLIPSTTNLFALGTSGRKFADLRATNATIDTINMTFGSVSTAPTLSTDMVNKAYADTKLALAGGTMTGPIVGLIANGIRTSSTALVDYRNVDDNRVSLTNGTNPPSMLIFGPPTETIATPRATLVLGTNGGTLGSGNIDYIYNGTVVATPLAGGNLNAIRFAHAGRAPVLQLLADTRSIFSGDVAARASWNESWWAHNLLQSTAMTTNTATTSLRLNTATSFYFSPALATAGINSLIPVVVNNSPVHDFNGPSFPSEWVQNLFPIAANAAGPSTTGGNRVRWTYSGLTTRRFDITVTGTYQTITPNTLIAFQGIVRVAGATTSFINGTASSWFETDTNRTFIAVSKKILRVNPGDIFEVAVGYDPLDAPNQLNSIVARDMTVTFVSMLNNT